MIKSKDLRIGDLVHVNHSPILPEESVCTIDSIYATTSFKTEHVNLILTEQDWRLGTWYCNDIDGIPLDSHILEKNGFNKIIPKKKFTKSLGDTSKFFKRCLVIELAQNRYKVSLNMKECLIKSLYDTFNMCMSFNIFFWLWVWMQI